MEIDFQVKLLPVDEGRRLVATCNEGYRKMINLLVTEEHNFDYNLRFLTSSMVKPNLIVEGSCDFSCLRFVAEDGGYTMLYPQPYTDRECGDWIESLENTLDRAIFIYKQIREDIELEGMIA